MSSSPFEVDLFIAATLVFLVVISLILTSIRKLKPFLYIIAVLALVAVVFLIKNLIEMNGCVQNVRTFNSALVKYRDLKGTYPRTMSALTPDFIRKIPVCPATGKDTYSPTYKITHEGRDCSFCCKGKNHGFLISIGSLKLTFFVKENYPEFDSSKNMKERVDIRH